MSLLLKRWKNGKYGVWTTISDGYLHKPKQLTGDEVVEFLSEDMRRETEKKIKELEETFPEGWYDKDTHERLSKLDNKVMTKEELSKLKDNK